MWAASGVPWPPPQKEPSGAGTRRRGEGQEEAHMANPKELVERGTKLFNAHDVDGLADLYAPSGQVLASGGLVAKGRDEIRKFQQSWFQGFPDAKVRSERLIVAGSTVVEEGTFTGTHTGVFPTPMGDIPPTGRKVDGPYVNIFDFEGDRVVRNRLTFDRLDLLEQLGLAPLPAMAASR
jgi:predicted ester cyclase